MITQPASHFSRIRKQWHRLSALFVALALFLINSQAATAHGTGGLLRIDGAALGPYTVMIWTTPTILRPGAVHVETAVFRGRSRVTHCRIEVTVTPLDNRSSSLQSTAGAANAANEFRHEAAFQLDQPGRYGVVVTVEDELQRGGDATFAMEIVRLPTVVRGFIYLQVVIVALTGGWIMKAGVEFVCSQKRNSVNV